MDFRSQLWSQMMDYEGTIRKIPKNKKKNNVSIDVESIPGVPGASGWFPGAPQHRKMMKKILFYFLLGNIEAMRLTTQLFIQPFQMHNSARKLWIN